MATHTPGPWFIHNLNGKLPNVMRRKMPHGEADTFYTSIHGQDKMRVVALDWGYGRKADEANAHLIAAAPDLLKELSHLVRFLEPLEAEGGLNVPGLATLNGARAAIAKATGK